MPPHKIWDDSVHHKGEFTDAGIGAFIDDPVGIEAPASARGTMHAGVLDEEPPQALRATTEEAKMVATSGRSKRMTEIYK
jgi:hypothetical protein